MNLHEIVSKYKALAQKLERHLSYHEMLDAGLTDWSIKRNGGVKGVRKLCGDFMNNEAPENDPLPEPKVLVLDLELAPILAYVWGLRDQNIGLNQIKEEWFIMSFAAKWLGAPDHHVMYFDIRETPKDDSVLVGKLWQLLDEADFVLTQNGKRFDTKKANARFVMLGFAPPSSFRQIDTLTIAKAKFGFTSNKLEWMTEKLCTKHKKLKHEKYSGMTLWTECLNGNMEAWNEMELYNRADILSTEELYLKIRSWKAEFNFNVFNDSLENRCICGSLSFRKSVKYTNAGAFSRMNCNECGAEYTDKSVNLLSKLKRASLKELSV